MDLEAITKLNIPDKKVNTINDFIHKWQILKTQTYELNKMIIHFSI